VIQGNRQGESIIPVVADSFGTGGIVGSKDCYANVLLMLCETHRMIKNNCMGVSKTFPIRLAAGLLAAILIDTVLQLVWKSAVLSLPSDGSPY
jgi:hypothetical protein